MQVSTNLGILENILAKITYISRQFIGDYSHYRQFYVVTVTVTVRKEIAEVVTCNG
jgi:hypothetical protein